MEESNGHAKQQFPGLHVRITGCDGCTDVRVFPVPARGGSGCRFCSLNSRRRCHVVLRVEQTRAKETAGRAPPRGARPAFTAPARPCPPATFSTREDATMCIDPFSDRAPKPRIPLPGAFGPQAQHLRNIRDLIEQLIRQLDRMESRTPLVPQLFHPQVMLVRRVLRDLPGNVTEYMDRLAHDAAGSALPHDTGTASRPDEEKLRQLTETLLDFAAWLDELESTYHDEDG